MSRGASERRDAPVGERRYTDRQIYRRVLGEARPYWVHIGLIFLLSLLAAPIALLLPVPLKIAVDNVIGDKPLPGWLDAVLPDSLQGKNGVLVFAVLLLVAVELLSQLQSLFTQLLRTYTGEGLTLRFRSQVFRQVQRLSISFHDRRGTADANYRIQSDAASLQTIAVDGVIPFVASVVTLVAMLYVAARIDVVLAAIALVVAPVIVVLTWAYRRRLRQRHREVKRLESSALSVAQEVLTSLRVVKAFGQEDREEQRFVGRAGEGMRARVRVAVIDGSFLLAIGLVTTVGTAAVLYTGVRRVEAGAITLGSLLLVMSYLTQLYGPLSTISRRVTGLQSAFASAERAFTLLDEEPDVPERPDAKPLRRAAGAVEFRDVSFAYDGGRPVVNCVSFRAEPGTRVGIAGPTGAGKTTLISLLTRFYDPTTGVILLDGTDIRSYRIADFRDQFAIVLQEPVLFTTTIAENIAYGRQGATDADIVAAAQAADVHGFIETLPDGYDALVGERGMTLSGGERQRISLARAFLKDAPILILDEPTSSVDLATEATIIDAMERLMSGRTTFMIAHRLSTLENCELRLELDGGRLRRPARAPAKAAARRAGAASRPRPRVVDPTRRQREVARVVRELLERPRARVKVGEELSHTVTRVHMKDGSVVVKRLKPAAARTNELAATRWLPAVGLDELAVKPLASKIDPNDARAWLVYEDLGESTLATHPEQAEAAVEAVAQLHVRFARHRLLAECRRIGRSRGNDFHVTSLEDAVAGLSAVAPDTDERARLREWLLECLATPVTPIDAPETLLHGDLWTTNILPGPRLIDWDKAGVGPLTYDLGTLLSKFPAEQRGPLLARYLDGVSALEWAPSTSELNRFFEASQRARIAQDVLWIARGLLESADVDWHWSELARRREWLERLEPVLS